MTETIICPGCGGPSHLQTRPQKLAVGRWSVEVEAELFVCEKCNEEFFAPGQLQANLKKAVARLREEKGLISPERIKALRERYGISQDQLEKVLGVGPKTVVRWERGTVVPTLAANRLLEVLDSIPAAMTELAERASVSLVASFPLGDWAPQAHPVTYVDSPSSFVPDAGLDDSMEVAA